MKEFDPNSIAVELVKQFSKPVYEGFRRLKLDINDKLKVTLNTCFEKYISRSYVRYSKTKTILYRDRPVNLRDFYIRTDLSIGFSGDIIKESDFFEYLYDNQRVVITGTAGSGKSTFCKSVFIDLIEKPVGIFPIFIELRHLNSNSDISLLDYITNILCEIEPTFNSNQLEQSLSLGKVLLIFDGFDEINNELREQYEKEIVKIASRYKNIYMLISSRNDSRFFSWDEFYVYKVLPLDKEKAKQLISKLSYDKEVKNKFLDALDFELFSKHKSFAENPLLLTMMLLTYEQIAEIPNKIHLFYEQAFLTLFNKHDSCKCLYKRKSFSNLPLDDFKKFLSSFSIVSYIDRKYFFTEKEIEHYLTNAIRISGMNVDKESFLKDLLYSVCILQRDGDGFSFTHRSFQEYFTAIFIVNFSSDNKYKLINKVAFINDRDDVIAMIFDINTDLLEQEWIIPKMKEIVSSFSLIPDTIDGNFDLLRKNYYGLVVHDASFDDEKSESDDKLCFRLYNRDDDLTRFFSMLYKIYKTEVSEYMKKYNNYSEVEYDKKNELIKYIKTLNHEGDKILVIENGYEPLASIKELLYEAKTARHVVTKLNFCKEKITSLTEKYETKQADLSDLFFN